jgi:hypothetical protein
VPPQQWLLGETPEAALPASREAMNAVLSILIFFMVHSIG